MVAQRTSYYRDSDGNVHSNGEVYVPDVEIIEEREIIEDEIRTQITVEAGEEVEMNVDQEEVDTNNKSTTIIAVTVSIVLLLAIAYGMRVVYQRMNAEELEKLSIKAKQEEIHMTKMKSVAKRKQKEQIDTVDQVID